MVLSPFVQGIIIGLTLAVPVGPISLICIRRAVDGGRLHGIISGIGVSTADSFYAAVAVLGLTVVSAFIIAQQVFFRAVAGLVLIAVGIRVFLSVPAGPGVEDGQESYAKDYLTLFAIAIANPMTIIFFLVILPGFGIVPGVTSLFTSAEFVLGIFSGSVVWWIVLCGSVGSVRSRLNIHNLQLINQISGVLIVLFGIGMLVLLLVHR
ncbi:MAG: LysE family translocator [Methanoregula sp.]|jgi:threonine/homoserine/homoserine lactone efflux protein|nr:LysE family translocator [Methanoregula sp.]